MCCRLRAEGEWDNPFQPEGEVSQDAELIVQLWKGGKLRQETGSLADDLRRAASSESGLAEASPQHLSPQHQAAAPPSSPPSSPTSPSSSLGSSGGDGGGGGGSPSKGARQEAAPGTQVAVLTDKQKHKNKLKKHCNMM